MECKSIMGCAQEMVTKKRNKKTWDLSIC